MSDGGPLICVEKRLEPGWGGTNRVTQPVGGSESDYDRACRTQRYLDTVAIRDGNVLILGDAPLDTAFWRSRDGRFFLVRIWFCEGDFDVGETMRSLRRDLFDHPAEVVDFMFESTQIVMFDSAYSGLDANKKIVNFEIEAGQYRILTQPHRPDTSTSLILHRFDRV